MKTNLYSPRLTNNREGIKIITLARTTKSARNVTDVPVVGPQRKTEVVFAFLSSHA